MKILPLLVLLLLCTGLASACPVEQYVEFHLVNATYEFGDLAEPLANTTVTITPQNFTESDLGFFSFFGIISSIPITYNATLIASDRNGILITTLNPALKYNLSIKNQSFYIYPVENEYYLFVR